MLIDTHVHLTDERYSEDRTNVIENFKHNNVEKVINIGFDFLSSKQGFELSQNHKEVYVALGIHPCDAASYTQEFNEFVKEIANNKKVVAIGEIGLDYHYGTNEKELQKQVFIKQLELANECKLPVVIHVRDAYEDVLNILKEHKHLLGHSGVMHCFGGSLEYAKEVLKLGLYLGFDGPITFKNSQICERVLQHLPIDKVLIETDCPYLAPHPYRGTRNEPKFVSLVAQKMAETYKISEQECILKTNQNAKNLFKKLRD
ncbi:MAG: hydrolase TatD [Tenericutes bacterium HGW-Tenericutes-4]|jgi:TatD DNase family protein|nr:MAG: hydrolase TatD [Tenericutes bacterium HGW-Tenericutes-4]